MSLPADTRELELSVRQSANTCFLFALAALALYLSYLVAHPFLDAIFAAVVLAVIFHPLHAKVDLSVRRPLRLLGLHVPVVNEVFEVFAHGCSMEG